MPSAPSLQELQPLRPKVLQAITPPWQQWQPCPQCLAKSQQGSGTARCADLLPPRICAKDLDLQFPAPGATRPRRDDRGSRHNQGKAIEGAVPRQSATLKQGSSSDPGCRGPRLGPGCPQPLHPPPARQAERPEAPGCAGQPERPRCPRVRGAAGGCGEPPAPPPPPAVNGLRGTLPTAGSGGSPLADAAERRPMGGGCQRSRARRAGGVQG